MNANPDESFPPLLKKKKKDNFLLKSMKWKLVWSVELGTSSVIWKALQNKVWR